MEDRCIEGSQGDRLIYINPAMVQVDRGRKAMNSKQASIRILSFDLCGVHVRWDEEVSRLGKATTYSTSMAESRLDTPYLRCRTTSVELQPANICAISTIYGLPYD